jgi:hypothetical protein
MTNHHELDAADNTGLCPDGATDEEHDTMLTMTGQCPWCGKEDSPAPAPRPLDESIAWGIIRANRTGPQGMGTPFRSILTGICNTLLALRHELRKEVI